MTVLPRDRRWADCDSGGLAEWWTDRLTDRQVDWQVDWQAGRLAAAGWQTLAVSWAAGWQA